MENILLLAAASAAIVKVLVDMLASTQPMPSWAKPLLAILLGIVTVLLLLVAEGYALTSQIIAQALLAGVLAGGGAIGVTEVHKQSRLAQDRRE